MVRPTRVTLVQSSSDGSEPAHDLDRMIESVRAHRDSDLVVFPEFALRATTPESATEAVGRLAAEGPAVAFGELRAGDGRVLNLATFAAPGGRTASYAKTHVHWTEAFTPGTDFPVFSTPLGPTGMLICFDAAFPEVPRALALNGAKAILNLSAIPSHFPLRIVHRRLVACSVFNQVFTFFVNRTGEGFLGGSAVVDPEGEVLAVADDREEHLTVEVDMDRVDVWRAQEPLYPHRRPDMYGAITHARPTPVRAPVGSRATPDGTSEQCTTY